MGSGRSLCAVALASVLGVAGCSGGAKEAVRTTGGPTSTVASGQVETGLGIGWPLGSATDGAGGQAISSNGSPYGGLTIGGVPDPTGVPGPAEVGGGSGGTAADPAAADGVGGTPVPAITVPNGGAGTAPAAVGDLAAWCPAERTLESRLRSLDPRSSPSELRDSVAGAREAMGPVVQTAPDEIRGDLLVVTDTYNQLFVALDQAGYDASRVSITTVQVISPANLKAAGDRLTAYVASHC